MSSEAGGDGDGSSEGRSNGPGESSSSSSGYGGGEFGDGTAGSPGQSDNSTPANNNDPGFGGVNAAKGYSDAPDSMQGFDAPKNDVVSFSTLPAKQALSMFAGMLPFGGLFAKGLNSMLPDTATYSRSEVEAGRDLGRGESGEGQQFFGGVTGGVGQFNAGGIQFKNPGKFNTGGILIKNPTEIKRDNTEIFVQEKIVPVTVKKSNNLDSIALIAAALTLVSTLYG